VFVLATAGHVDHGKSTLVEALTGQQPDRLAEERRRGLTIELGYCWTTLDAPDGALDLAFVDVPGHERFVPTMLSGVGPVPAVLFVVAADDGWMPQSSEHLAALDALGVRHGLVVVTRSDLADPASALREARDRLAGTTLAAAGSVAVSARTGAGMDALREALIALVRSLPPPDPDAAVRLWVDRAFSVAGAGTVVTATLAAGRVAVGDRLGLDGHEEVRVRGLQSLEQPVHRAGPVARVALALGGDAPAALGRGAVLTTPDAFRWSDEIDVLLSGQDDAGGTLPAEPVLHIGAASVPVRARLLGPSSARLRLARPLPLRVGDRVLLRDAGSRQVVGADVADPMPPPLTRRGAAARRDADLRRDGARPDLGVELRRRGSVRQSVLRRLGVPLDDVDRLAMRSGDWLLDRELAPGLSAQLRELVLEHDRQSPLDPGVPLAAAARSLGLPSAGLLAELLSAGLRLVEGRVRQEQATPLPVELERGVQQLAAEMAESPFAAPAAGRLVELGLHPRAVAAAERAGRLMRVGDVVLLPGADVEAVRRLAELPQPFTTSQARMVLETTRRVVLPLLGMLDARGRTRRLPDDRRQVVLP
jgi:selenocysteine-specific elongation factor